MYFPFELTVMNSVHGGGQGFHFSYSHQIWTNFSIIECLSYIQYFIICQILIHCWMNGVWYVSTICHINFHRLPSIIVKITHSKEGTSDLRPQMLFPRNSIELFKR